MTNEKYFRVLHWNDDPSAEGVEYLVQGIFPRRGVGVLLGKSGSGKTQFAMHLAFRVATGNPLIFTESLDETLGRVNFTGATLYITGEGEVGIKARFLAAKSALLLNAPEPDFDHREFIIPLIIQNRLKFDGQIDELIEHISEYSLVNGPHELIRLIIIDTLPVCFDIDNESDNSEMQRIMLALKKFADKFDCFVLLVGHPTKSRKDKQEHMRGASTTVNSADSVIILQKKNQSSYSYLEVSKVRDGQGKGAKATFKIMEFNGAPAFVATDQVGPELRPQRTTMMSEIQKHIMTAMECNQGKATTVRRIKAEILPYVKEVHSVLNRDPIDDKSHGRNISRAIRELCKQNKLLLQGGVLHPI